MLSLKLYGQELRSGDAEELVSALEFVAQREESGVNAAVARDALDQITRTGLLAPPRGKIRTKLVSILSNSVIAIQREAIKLLIRGDVQLGRQRARAATALYRARRLIVMAANADQDVKPSTDL